MSELKAVMDAIRAIARSFWDAVAGVVDLVVEVFSAFLKWLANLIIYVISGKWISDLIAWFFGFLRWKIVDSTDDPSVPSQPQFAADGMTVAPVARAWGFTDSGPRRFFSIDAQNRVTVVGPDIAPQVLMPAGETAPKAISYHSKRLPDTISCPPFDMVAADGGRVFAKEKDKSKFYFTMLEPMFRENPNKAVSSVYFKLDPQQGIQVPNADRLTHLERDNTADHPAAVRFPLFRLAMRQSMVDSMAVNVDINLKAWHQIDARPPQGCEDPPQSHRYPPSEVVVTYERLSAELFGRRPRRSRKSYRLQRVLSIGVGHEHWHEHDCTIYAGEIDSLDGPGLQGVLEERNCYQYFNGPVDDKGGFIDGTVNYYILGQFLEDGDFDPNDPPPNAFGILWLDEQAALSERWRLLHPDDSKFSGFVDLVPSAVVQYLARDAGYHTIRFDRGTFWCPFLAGHIYGASGMAVSRQMIAVTGWDPDEECVKVYTIHFGFGTCDRTWRWRRIPDTSKPPEEIPQTSPIPTPSMAFSLATGSSFTVPVGTGDDDDDEVIPPPPPPPPRGERPKGISPFGLREDMTLWMSQEFPQGKWYWFQKVLPADQGLRPAGSPLPFSGPLRTFRLVWGSLARILHLNGPKPRTGYRHPWQFHRAEIFESIHSRYSHFGVYEDTVNSRSQYYEVEVAFDDPQAGKHEDWYWADMHQDLEIVKRMLDWEKFNKLIKSIENDDVVKVADAILHEFGPTAFDSFTAFLRHGPSLSRIKALLRKLRDSNYSRESTRKGLFNDKFVFHLRYRAGVGWIMIHADKRDDDLLECTFDPRPDLKPEGDWGGVEHQPGAERLWLTPVESPGNLRELSAGRASVKLIKRHRVLSPPRIAAAEVTVYMHALGTTPRLVRIVFEWSPGTAPHANNRIEENVWRVRLGALTKNGNAVGPAVLLLSVIREGHFHSVAGRPNCYSYDWSLSNASPAQITDVQKYVSTQGRAAFGTSLWFEDIVGHVGIADVITFKVVQDEIDVPRPPLNVLS